MNVEHVIYLVSLIFSCVVTWDAHYVLKPDRPNGANLKLIDTVDFQKIHIYGLLMF